MRPKTTLHLLVFYLYISKTLTVFDAKKNNLLEQILALVYKNTRLFFNALAMKKRNQDVFFLRLSILKVR
jgi:hypothetical protein